MTMSLDKLKESVFDYISSEIYLAHEALSIYMIISESSKLLNGSEYCQLFGILQRQALGSFVISICKLYEPIDKKKKYPKFSIPTALALFEENIANILIPNVNIDRLREYINHEINPIDDTFAIENTSDIAQIICEHFKKNLPKVTSDTNLDIALKALKVLRDKRIAHHEEHDLVGLDETDLESAIYLLCFAKTFVNIIGYQFFRFSPNNKAEPAEPQEFSPEKSQCADQLKRLIQNILKYNQNLE